MAGYTRQSEAGIVDGAAVSASDLNAEFNQLESAMDQGSGHSHDGTAGNAPKITNSGLANNAVATATIQDDAVTGAKIDSATTITAASFVGNLDADSATIDSLTITSGTAVTAIDTNLSTVSNSDDTLASAKAIKAYVDAQVDTADQLTELTDVTITSVTDNEVLAYNNATTKWINQTATEAGLQPNDAGLTSIAGLTTAADKMIYTTASDTYATTSLTAAGRDLLDDADASAQRTTLGLAIGSNVQAHNAKLDTIAGLSTTDGNIIVGNGTTWVAESGDTARTSLGLAIGTNVQAYDAGLNSIAGLTTEEDKMIYTTALDTYAVADLSAFGRSIIDDADASAARTTLGLGTAATTASSDYATSTQGTTADNALPKAGGTMTGDITFSGTQTFAVTEAMISDLGSYITDYTVTESDVTTHQAALSITESQISDLGAYLTGNETITLSGDATGSGTTAITVALAENTVGVNELNLSEGTAGQFLKTDGAGTISFADAPTQATSFTVLDVDNINIDGNTISSTDTDGDIILTPNGSGDVELRSGGGSNIEIQSYAYQAGPGATASNKGFFLKHFSENSVSSKVQLGQLDWRYVQPTAGFEDSSFSLFHRRLGSLVALLSCSNVTGYDLKCGTNLRFNSGDGIDFSATTDASGMTDELLDDYEEGTWTPNLLTFSGTFTTMSITGVTCSYVKIGKQVTVQGAFNTSNVSVGTAVGGLRLTGIPFTPANDHARGSCTGSQFAGENPTIVSTDNSNELYFWYVPSVTSNPERLQASDLQTGTGSNNIFRFTITYEV